MVRLCEKNEGVRDRLLARLPQPENLAAYREETAVLLVKHKKALFWEKFLAISVVWLGIAVWLMVNSSWGPKLDTTGRIFLDSLAGLLLFTGGIAGIGSRINQSKLALMKEIKQVQIQILELQASLKKDGENQL
jgi:hypothetical protein